MATAGLNVRIFHDRGSAFAPSSRDFPAVLAHVIAHEIGHVLLRTTGHSHRLMDMDTR